MASPILNFFTLAGVTIPGLDFGTLNAGDESIPVTVNLWNNKGGIVVVDTAENIRISILQQDGGKDTRAVKEGFVLARSSGLTNPNVVGNFFDDNQVAFTPLTDVNDLLIGNIPNNSARTILFKMKVPTDATVSGLTLQFIAGHGSNVTPYLFSLTVHLETGLYKRN